MRCLMKLLPKIAIKLRNGIGHRGIAIVPLMLEASGLKSVLSIVKVGKVTSIFFFDI